jgi:hypothetical protein
VVHHIESDQTLETSAPTPATGDVFRWMQDRATVPAAPSADAPPAPDAPAAKQGRLRITDLEAREAGSALVFVGHVSLVDADEPVSCAMRCQLQRIDSEENVTVTWSGEIRPGAGIQGAAISSTPVTITAGVYRGIFFAEDKRLASRRAFCEVPLFVVS